MAQCDTHVKVSKHTNDEFQTEFDKSHKQTNDDIKTINKTIHSILDAQDEVPLWEELKALQKLERENDKEILEKMAYLKHNVNAEREMKLLKFERENANKGFKPSKFKFSTDIVRFLNKKFGHDAK